MITIRQEHERMAHLLPSYATGGLDPDEALAVRKHLRRCGRCRMLAAEYRAAFDAIGLSVPLADPPEHLRANILENLPQQPPYRLPPPVRFILDHPRGVVAASLAILLLFAASVWLNISGVPGTSTGTNQVQSARVDPTEVAGGILTVLNGTAAAPRARAIIAVGRDRTSAVLYAFGLPRPPQGHVYQLWLMKNGVHTNGGIIRVTPEGHAVHYIQLAGPITQFASFGITLEPAAGSSQGPTGNKILEDESLEPRTMPDADIEGVQNVQTSMYGIIPE
jgi:anti-sigma-K factor RskA